MNEKQRNALELFSKINRPAYPYEAGGSVRIATCMALERRGLLAFHFDNPTAIGEWYKFVITDAGRKALKQ